MAAKTVLGPWTVIAFKFQPGPQPVLGNGWNAVQYLGRDETAMLGQTMIRTHARNFIRLVSMGRIDHSSRLYVASFLQSWKRYLAPGGRVVVEMFREGGNFIEHWEAVEQAYRQAVSTTDFNLEQINGLELEKGLSSGPTDVHAYIVSIKQTAEMIRPVDPARADDLMSTVALMQERLEIARKNKTVGHMVERLLGGNRRLFATFRLG